MHRDALDEKGQLVLPRLAAFRGFSLAGGTALALQIGHRRSVDFDLFSPAEISADLLRKVEAVFPSASLMLSVNNPDELTIFIDGVKVSFIQYPFPVFSEMVSYEGIAMLTIPLIAATKAYTIGRHASFKDYVDLYFILAEKHDTLDGIMRRAEALYGGAFNTRLFLEQLTYTEDVHDTEIIFLKPAVTPERLQEFFASRIKESSLL